jgi:hypothetical protein
VQLAYQAWILHQPPAWNPCRYLHDEAPHLLGTVALYDLSKAYKGTTSCFKLNETNSQVLQAFERFLYEEYEIATTPFTRRQRR